MVKIGKNTETEKDVDDSGDGPLIDSANKDVKKLLQIVL